MVGVRRSLAGRSPGAAGVASPARAGASGATWVSVQCSFRAVRTRPRPFSSPSGARCATNRGCKPRIEDARAVGRGCSAGGTAAPLGRTAMSHGGSKAGFPRENPASGSGSLRREGLSRTLPAVGARCGDRDRTRARTRSASSAGDRSRIAFSRRTSQKSARDKPECLSCQPGAQLHGRTDLVHPRGPGRRGRMVRSARGVAHHRGGRPQHRVGEEHHRHHRHAHDQEEGDGRAVKRNQEGSGDEHLPPGCTAWPSGAPGT